MTDYIGYLASLLVAVSITIKGGFYFRILNLAGSICFITYAIFIDAKPLAFFNIYAAGVNAYYLFKLLRKEKAQE